MWIRECLGDPVGFHPRRARDRRARIVVGRGRVDDNGTLNIIAARATATPGSVTLTDTGTFPSMVSAPVPMLAGQAMVVR
jgi:hypothetical protein